MKFKQVLVLGLVLVSVLAVAACGQSFTPSTAPATAPGGQPGRGKPAVTLGTKNFTEQYILGELYAGALRAKGYTVNLKTDVGPSGAADAALTGGQIDLYPEYTGVVVAELANLSGAAPGAGVSAQPPPGSATQAYEQAASFEDSRGLKLLNPAPFQNVDRVATSPTFAAAHGLHTMDDLKRLGPFTFGAPPENRTRYEGLRGMQQAYGLSQIRFVAFPIGAQYAALDRGQVQTITVFTTDGRLTHGHYVVLSDPRNIFGYQNEAPVVRKSVLDGEGPQFAQTLDAVSATLTTAAMQQMNAAVDIGHRSPAEVARQFLAAHGLG